MSFTFHKIHCRGRCFACYCLLVIITIASTHLLLSGIHERYRRATSLTRILPDWVPRLPDGNLFDFSRRPTWKDVVGDEVPQEWHLPQTGHANATFVILVREKELPALVRSLMQLESRFNHKYHYPYVFLSEEPFSKEFKNWTSLITSSKVQYGVIPQEQWNPPTHINRTLVEELGEVSRTKGVLHGDDISYKNMCRFNSGFFFRHELVQQYQYYWRVEPNVDFFCDIEEDPFVYMRENQKTYGFTISLKEFENTIPTLWNVTRDFMAEYPEHIAEDNAMGFLSKDGGKTYNLCHFWSNFEIADMNFWRSEAYLKYFEYLDARGGFYYERWGDAPVHSIAAALFLPKHQIHFFNEIGYKHSPFQHCPPQGDVYKRGRCSCDQRDNFDPNMYSCTIRFHNLFY